MLYRSVLLIPQMELFREKSTHPDPPNGWFLSAFKSSNLDRLTTGNAFVKQKVAIDKKAFGCFADGFTRNSPSTKGSTELF